MAASVDQANIVIKHVWTEPRFRAEVEWAAQTPTLAQQIEAQVGRAAIEQYVEGGGWPDPDQEITVVLPDEAPDWDWWEPTTRWRREAARARELDALLSEPSA